MLDFTDTFGGLDFGLVFYVVIYHFQKIPAREIISLANIFASLANTTTIRPDNSTSVYPQPILHTRTMSPLSFITHLPPACQ
jgi:hypothetical protein